jgi:hypothetical protein
MCIILHSYVLKHLIPFSFAGICNQQVAGSTPIAGFGNTKHLAHCQVLFCAQNTPDGFFA